MKLDELTLYKLAFKVIEDNIEWGIGNGNEGVRFTYFVDGVLALFDNIKQEIENNETCDDENKNY